MEKNTFQVNEDYKPYEVVSAINRILKNSFGLQIEEISPEDSEILEYKISTIK